MESEITYEYKDFLENGMKFTAYRNTFMGESTVHKHNFLELIYIISGAATHYIDDKEYKVAKGDLLLIDTDQTHYHKSETGVLFADMVLLPDFISDNLYSSHTAIDIFAYYLYNSEQTSSEEIPRTPLIPVSYTHLGLISGGITGITSRIIHSGLFPERRNASTTSRRFMMRSFF